MIALGDRVAGIFGDDETVAAVQSAADVTGELLWRLPVPEETRERIRTERKVADLLQHNWVRWGSALWAAAFLREFVGDKPFVHLDVAGPAWNDGSPWGTCPRAAPATASRPWSPTSRRWRRRRPARQLSRSCCPSVFGLCRRLNSRIRVGTPTTAASYDGMLRRLQKSCAQLTDGTRRRVHSPSCATSSRVTDDTVVCGSRKPSTPRRDAAHSLRCFSSAESD